MNPRHLRTPRPYHITAQCRFSATLCAPDPEAAEDAFNDQIQAAEDALPGLTVDRLKVEEAG
ncbi:MAG: hypothetical protein EUB_02667 [Eubacterium sp.]|uniref:hypothetical protein n=1 Tax=Eubacterium sp. TaxID=142586 RepID=UPI00303F1821